MSEMGSGIMGLPQPPPLEDSMAVDSPPLPCVHYFSSFGNHYVIILSSCQILASLDSNEAGRLYLTRFRCLAACSFVVTHFAVPAAPGLVPEMLRGEQKPRGPSKFDGEFTVATLLLH